jgi:hypothetical protein
MSERFKAFKLKDAIKLNFSLTFAVYVPLRLAFTLLPHFIVNLHDMFLPNWPSTVDQIALLK